MTIKHDDTRSRHYGIFLQSIVTIFKHDDI